MAINTMKVIDELVDKDPMGILYAISDFAPPSDGWEIPEVAYALRKIYEKLTESE